jgi:hypothetical protein
VTVPRLVRRALAATTALVVAAGCASTAATGSSSATTDAPSVSAADLRGYVAAVEKVRLPVNALLEGADPILDAYHQKKITPAAASGRMSALEQRFADYTVDINALEPTNPVLRELHTPYAHTYFYEDSYLATLASDLNEGDFDNLPNTQAAQRLAIVEWRTQLEVLARRAGVTLPPDIDQAGRGEIAPSPEGS